MKLYLNNKGKDVGGVWVCEKPMVKKTMKTPWSNGEIIDDWYPAEGERMKSLDHFATESDYRHDPLDVSELNLEVGKQYEVELSIVREIT